MRSLLVSSVVSVLVVGCCCTQELIWGEEFDGLDTNVWDFDKGAGGNQELQEYTRDNVRVENGKLIISVKEGDDGNITSGRIFSKVDFTFHYGKIEASIKLPNMADGLWPAFWMLGTNYPEERWPASGTITVMQAGSGSAREKGRSVNKSVGSSLHWEADDGSTVSGEHEIDTMFDLTSSFLKYEVEWTPDRITTKVQGTEIFSQDISACQCDELHQPFFFGINVAVGGSYTHIYERSKVTAPLPAEMMVDYIRVYNNGHTVQRQAQKSPPTYYVPPPSPADFSPVNAPVYDPPPVPRPTVVPAYTPDSPVAGYFPPPPTPFPVPATPAPVVTPAPTPEPTPFPVAITPAPVATPAPVTPAPVWTQAPITPEPTPWPITPDPTPWPTTPEPTPWPTTPEPTRSPTEQPSPFPRTREPTRSPTESPTKEPTLEPTKLPTDEPSLSPSVGPSLSPSSAPTVAPLQSLVATGNIMALQNVEPLDSDQTLDWQKVTWEHLNASLPDILDAELVNLTVAVTGQNPPYVAARRRLFRFLQTSTQEITFDTVVSIQSAKEVEDVNSFVDQAFETQEQQEAYLDELKNSNNAFANVSGMSMSQGQSGVSGIEQAPAVDGGGAGKSRVAIIVGITVAAVVVAFIGLFLFRRGQKRRQTPVQASFSGSKAVRTSSTNVRDSAYAVEPDESLYDFDLEVPTRSLDDSGVYTSHSSVTMDHYDDASAPGTPPPPTPTGLAESYERDTSINSYRFTVEAPPGLLGVVLESSVEGKPSVYGIKNTSPLADTVQVGDLLLNVDGLDVSEMDATAVSRLIASKKQNKYRQLLFVRQESSLDPVLEVE